MASWACVNLLVFLIYSWPGCNGDQSSDPSLKSITNLPVPPDFQSRWGREREPRLSSNHQIQTQRTAQGQRNPDVCRRLVGYANHYNTDGYIPRLNSTQDYVSKLLGTQNCSFGFSDSIAAIHVLRNEGHVEPLGAADCGEEGNMRTVKVYRLRFAKRVARDSLQFSQLKLLLPIVIGLKDGECPQQQTKYKVVLLDGETVVSRFVEGFKTCNTSSTAPGNGNDTITVVLDATGIMFQVFLPRSDLDESVHLVNDSRLANLSLKLKYQGSMFAEIAPSAKVSLVLLQADDAVSVGCHSVLKVKNTVKNATGPAPPFLRKICRNICSRQHYDINMQQYVTSRYSGLNIHASMGSVDVGACRGGCQVRPMRSCTFERYPQHRLLLSTLKLRIDRRYGRLPGMSCAVDVMRLKSILLPYSYENNATEYSDCGIVRVKQARIPRGDDGCWCT